MSHDRRSGLRGGPGRVVALAVAAGFVGGAGNARAVGATPAIPTLSGPGTAPAPAAGAMPGLQAAADSTTFVVLGHIRGDRDGGLHPRLAELLDEVRGVGPDFVVLTGDIIWGDPDAGRDRPADRTAIEAQWTALDSALSTLGVPVYRVPGNHDIGDPVTYEIWRERYGPLPAVVDREGTRLILLSSAWEPGEPDRRAVRGFGYQIDEAQLAFLREKLAEGESPERAFVFVHHVLWWEDDEAPWWTEVHPLLAGHGVRAVFTGDYGPVKFSHTVRDGVDYFQSVIAPDPSLGILRGHEWNRLLAGQFDNYLVVRTGRSGTDVEVATVGEVSSGHFTRERWREVHGRIVRPPTPGGREHLMSLWALPKGKLAILGALGVALAAGLGLGAFVARRRG